MMDFEDAAQRLAKDQKKLIGSRRAGSRNHVAVSQKAKKQAEYQRKQQEKLRLERERKKRQQQYQQSYMSNCHRSLKVKSLSNASNGGLQLTPTSIYGDGDKIALPPSVLETLTSSLLSMNTTSNNTAGNPWMFRIGILNPNYQFPASPLVQALQPPFSDDDDDAMDVDDTEYDSEDDHEGSSSGSTFAAYLDELNHKYLSYTHCTVVEFTQEEGHVGIPQPIASALLKPNNNNNNNNKEQPENNNNNNNHNDTTKPIPIKRTVDPSNPDSSSSNNNDTNTDSMLDQTPGHIAWGAFDIPDMPLEITMVQLPKGKGCTLVPTKEAIQHGFYNLKDIKLVLEQSLIRSRATLSVHDIITTWHRGIKFELQVTQIVPPTFHAVTCINTDIEVTIGEVEENENTAASKEETNHPTNDTTDKKDTESNQGGYKLGTSSGSATTTAPAAVASTNEKPQPKQTTSISLPKQPPEDVTEGVCTVQIRHKQGSGKYRLDVSTATIHDLFQVALSVLQQEESDPTTFRLVTRFPRRVFVYNDNNNNNSNDDSDKNDDSTMHTLQQAGIGAGQELFLVEYL